jgi:carboxyl-terminal processing protease
MLRVLLPILILTCLVSACGGAPPPQRTDPTPTLLPDLDRALAIMQANSFYTASADWEALREFANEMTAVKHDPVSVRFVLERVLLALGDKHGYVLTSSQVESYETLTTADSRPPQASLLADRLGYLLVTEFASGRPEEQVRYAQGLQELIREVDASRPCGWVVDLRGNLGGSMWAMLAGVGPVLGEGESGAFVFTDGHSQPWAYREGQALLEGQVAVAVPSPWVLSTSAPPVAILTDGMTVSSGEALALAFRGRPGTRSFGQPTAGYSSAIETYLLDDGSMLGLTVAVFTDRNGVSFTGGPIPPDEIVSLPAGGDVPAEAVTWLLAQPPCRTE